MAIIAAIGMPIVLTYTGIVYWTFRGKVKLGEFSYEAFRNTTNAPVYR